MNTFLFCSYKCHLFYSVLCVVILSFDVLKPILLPIFQTKSHVWPLHAPTPPTLNSVVDSTFRYAYTHPSTLFISLFSMSYNSRFLLYRLFSSILEPSAQVVHNWICGSIIVLFLCKNLHQIINTAKHIHDLWTFLFYSHKCRLFYSFLCIVILLNSLLTC